MRHPFQQFMHDILLDIAIDHRVESGIVDFMNESHVEVLAEKLIDRGLTPKAIQEVVNAIAIRDGKYPDRQAYNKEGWLVTFPTPEHRNAALKKKTHFTSDPTNGQGGMNLYYKKKGQQKRQTTQGTSEVEPTDQNQQAQPPQTTTQTEPAPQNNQPADGGGESSALPQSGGTQPAQQSQKSSEPTQPAQAPAATDDTQASASNDTPPQDKQSAQGNTSAPSAEPQSTSTDELVQLTKQYAMSKQWSSTPYGDWNDSTGKLAAVTALDGQVVPIKFVDREELKRMAEQKGITLPSVT